jgi:DNA-binding CsgD family transcriptional regulator
MQTRDKYLDRVPPLFSTGLSTWLLETLNGSKVGVAVYDKTFRYVGVNSAVAAMNGVARQDHLGQTPREVIGRASRIIEPQIDRVFETGRPVYHHEFSAKLPTRTERGYWIQDYFPISDGEGKVGHVGIFVVEVTEQRRLEAIVRRLGSPGSQCATKSPAGILSDREVEVLNLLAQGKSNKEAASALRISEKTVETYRSRTKLKLGLSSLAELIHYAIRNGIVKP